MPFPRKVNSTPSDTVVVRAENILGDEPRGPARESSAVPDTLDAAGAQMLSAVLRRLHADHRDLFDSLFLRERAVPTHSIPPSELGALQDWHLVERIDDCCKARFRIFAYRGRFILTDFVSRPNLDRVFATDEAGPGYLIDHLNIRADDVVLDVGAGAGTFAVFCAEKAQHVVATDINPRVLPYARFNAALNGVAQKIAFLAGDLFEPVKGQSFDLVVSNPPPLPVPPEVPFFIHSDGGLDGLCVFRRLLANMFDHARRGTRFQFVMPSLAGPDGSLITRALETALGGQRVHTRLQPLYPQPIGVNPHLVELYAGCKTLAVWRANLERGQLTNWQCFFVDIRPSSVYRLQHCRRVSGATVWDWGKRMRKYVRPVTDG